jgi:hypothetical protein
MRREELPFARSFTRSFVRLTSWSKENDNGGKKVMTRGRRSKIIGWTKIIILSPIGVWNLECIDTHCWAGSCSWASICSISLTYQSEHATTFSCYNVDLPFEWQIDWIREDWMLPSGIAGMEFHHEHRVLYKSLPEYHDHLCKCIFSDGRLSRIARTEFFRRQSVMSFADRREQFLAEAGRWVNGGTCKIKESTICEEACHWLHRFSWKVGEICAIYRCVVPSALASYLIHFRTHGTRHTSWWAVIGICLFVGPDTRRREGLLPDEKSKTILVPGGVALSLFRIESWA